MLGLEQRDASPKGSKYSVIRVLCFAVRSFRALNSAEHFTMVVLRDRVSC